MMLFGSFLCGFLLKRICKNFIYNPNVIDYLKMYKERKNNMYSKYIEVPRKLTSYEFYNNLLLQKSQLSLQNNQEIVLDFSKTDSIEPLTIPNLLCLGYEIRRKYRKTAIIYIPETSSSGGIKNYLNQIGFIEYARKYGLYEFASLPYGGIDGKKIDPLCGTLYFDINSTIDEINRGVEWCVAPFTEQYLIKFRNPYFGEKKEIRYDNDICNFLEEVISNCKIHAESFSFTTLHAKYSAGKIYIAVSDFGCGFLETMRKKSECENEITAILAGIYRRRDSKVYGLYNVIRKVLEYGGKFRIHSKNVQIIFTPRLYGDFVDGNLLGNWEFQKYNIKKNIPFDGVHIEIELPMQK